MSYLVGDDVADVLVLYTARLTSSQLGDAVVVNVLGPGGDPETASFALGPNATVAAVSARSEFEEPDNSAAIGYMQDAMRLLRSATSTPITTEDLQTIADSIGDGS